MGFNVLVGGFFSATRCAEAIPMDAWVPVEGVVPMTHAILTAFRDLGARANRQKCRMMWLVEDMGMDKWRAEITRRMPGEKLVSQPTYQKEPFLSLPSISYSIDLQRVLLVALLSQEAAGVDLCDPTRERRSLYGVHPQKQPGLNFVGLAVPVGRLEVQDMYDIADLCDKYGDGIMRLTVEQNFIISGVPDAKVLSQSSNPHSEAPLSFC